MTRGLARRGAARQLRESTRLHLACGSHLLEGWTNVDLRRAPGVVGLDLTAPLPVRTASVEFIYNEHFIEHIDRDAGLRLFRECHRVLRPGGVLRVSTPDLRMLVDAYLTERLDEWADVDWRPATPCRLLNEGLRLWSHRFVYDEPELRGLLEEAGFGAVAPVPWRESEHAALRGLECRPFHGEVILEAVR